MTFINKRKKKKKEKLNKQRNLQCKFRRKYEGNEFSPKKSKEECRMFAKIEC